MSRSRVVVLGGGFRGLFTALELAGHTDVTLITEADHFLFTPMLYEYLSGEVEACKAHGCDKRNCRDL